MLLRALISPLAALLVLTGCAPAPSTPETPTPTSESSPTEKATLPEELPEVEVQPRVGIQLFQWNWDSIAAHCTEELGPNNYDFVLLSPAQEHIQGEAWWTSYQPVSYRIESKLGTREQFRAMVQTCHDAGVKIIADAVINHMAGIDGGVGVAGSEFTHHNYPGIYTEDDFTLDCGTDSGNIENYNDREQVQNCRLVNLSDLRTDTEHVQDTIASFMNDLTALGVDGFRIDAAKHMPAQDVAAIVGLLDGDPLIISEVIRASREPIQPEEYLDAGAVFAFQFAKDLTALMPAGGVRRAPGLKDGDVPRRLAYTFVTNHDTERNGQTLTYKDGARYQLANLVMLAVDYGTPVLYSGYAFDDRDAGAPQTDGRIDDATCAPPSEAYEPGAWVCDHTALAGMVTWAAVVGDAPVENQWDQQRAVAFDRGDRGLVAINAHPDEPLALTFATNLPDGLYCDVAFAPFDADEGCTTTEYIVTEGEVDLEVAPMSAVALHVGAQLPVLG